MAMVCVTCRSIDKHCEHEKIYTGTRWAAPRKTNDKAWKLIAEGDIWWDKKRVARPIRTKKGYEQWLRQKQAMQRWRERLAQRSREEEKKRKEKKQKKKHNQPTNCS